MARAPGSAVAEKCACGRLRLDADSADAATFFHEAAERDAAPGCRDRQDRAAAVSKEPGLVTPPAPVPTDSFAGGRYQVERFLGEGGKKRVYLAHDELLDRDVAFALIKTEGLDEVGRERIVREAQAMGRMGCTRTWCRSSTSASTLGTVPQPYVVTELMGGGDVEGLLEAEEPPRSRRALEIAKGDGARPRVRARAGRRAPRPEAGQRLADRRTASRRSATSGSRCRRGAFAAHAARDDGRHLRLHAARAGARPGGHAAGRPVLARGDALRAGDGQTALRRRRPHRRDLQHINTRTRVAPSWHSEHCPPDLEALILRLLAKVPADRPASAIRGARRARARRPQARSASHSDSQAQPARPAGSRRLRRSRGRSWSGSARLRRSLRWPGLSRDAGR